MVCENLLGQGCGWRRRADGETVGDIFVLSKMLGHSDVKITDQHYMKLVPGYREKMSKATRRLAYKGLPTRLTVAS